MDADLERRGDQSSNSEDDEEDILDPRIQVAKLTFRPIRPSFLVRVLKKLNEEQ